VLLAIPMTVLYFAAVGISLWHDRIVDRRVARELGDDGLSDGPVTA